MPRVSDAHRSAQRQRILDAATEVALQKGLAKVSMSDVIEHSGLSAGAIYGYFENKDELIRECARAIIVARASLFTTARDQHLDPAQVMRQLMDPEAGMFAAPSLVVEVWAEAPHTPGLLSVAVDAVALLSGAFRDYLAHWFQSQRALAPDEARRRAEELVPAFMGLVQGCFVSTHLGLFDTSHYGASVEALLREL